MRYDPAHMTLGQFNALPEDAASPLRTGTPAVVTRVHEGRCLVDLRCVPEDRDGDLADAIGRVLAGLSAGRT